LPKLINYAVRIPPGTHTYAIAETQITWRNGSGEFMTTGLDIDETVSAIKATEKMLNLVQSKEH
jgi:D-citramalate synthase